ncbi:hypothetical protein E3U43_019298, partial [Larimichthys crocea]
RESRFRPGGSVPFVGLCHRERRGERALPVCAAFSNHLCSERTRVTAARQEERLHLFAQKRECGGKKQQDL